MPVCRLTMTPFVTSSTAGSRRYRPRTSTACWPTTPADEIVMFDVAACPYDGARGIDQYSESWQPFFERLRRGASSSRRCVAVLRAAGGISPQSRQPTAAHDGAVQAGGTLDRHARAPLVPAAGRTARSVNPTGRGTSLRHLSRHVWFSSRGGSRAGGGDRSDHRADGCRRSPLRGTVGTAFSAMPPRRWAPASQPANGIDIQRRATSSSPRVRAVSASQPRRRSGADESDDSASAALQVERNPVGKLVRLAVGMLPGRWPARAVQRRPVVDLLRSTTRWVTAGQVVHRHSQRPVPGQRDHAGGGVPGPLDASSRRARIA